MLLSLTGHAHPLSHYFRRAMASSAICTLLTLPRFAAQEHSTFTSRCGVMLTRLTVAEVKLPELLLLLLLLILTYILSLSALDKKTNYEVKINKIKDTIHSRQSLRQWKDRKRIRKGRHQASQESSSRQHHGIHQARYSTTCSTR